MIFCSFSRVEKGIKQLKRLYSQFQHNVGLVLIPIFSLFSTHSSAQTYGNEWINYNQEYFKFQVYQDGAYRINTAALIASGVPVSSLDPSNFQIFGRGVEQYIHIEGGGDGSMDPGDYIEFYALSNDGWLDEVLYKSKKNHPNPYYSLFNDTATYYLTWNNSTTNRRLILETSINFSSFTPDNYFLYTSIQNYNSNYYDGKTNLGGSTDANYVSTEGWFDGAFNLGGSRVKNINTANSFGSGNAKITWGLIGSSNHSPTDPDHHLRVTFAGTVFDTIYDGYQLLKKSFSVSVNNLGATNTPFNFQSINDLGSGADRSAISYISITYPHNTSLGNANELHLTVENSSSQSKSRFDFTAFNSGGSAFLYDLTNHRRILTVTSGSNLQVLIPNGSGNKNCYLFSENSITNVPQLFAVNGSGTFTNLLNLERDSAYVIIYHPKLNQSAAMYENYRNMTGHSAVRLNILELYDQFAYGVNSHPLSIRGAMDYMLDNWNSTPQYLFLFGKSVRAKLYRKNAGVYAQNLVPSFGNPASDILLTSGLNNTILEPALATGRISANNDDQGIGYLNKVMEYESNSTAEWMKTILHFAGGNSKTESDRFSGYLANYENILEDTLFGGFVHTFKKSTTAPIQITLSDSISNLINSGVSIMTFFGHASTSGGFDQNIDDPQNYSNKGKYPLLIANSCFAGDIHGVDAFSTSEQFMIIKDRGMIGFIASTDLGFESLLNFYSTELIRNIGQKNYGGTIGKHMQNTIKAIQGDGSNGSIRSVCFEMTLHGDPAVKINYQPKPDYQITASSIYFNPKEVTTERDSFDINIVITNLGKAIDQTIAVTCQRIYPNKLTADTTYDRLMPGVRFRDTLTIKMPTDAIKGDGLNRFNITVDALSTVDELREDNNFVSTDLFIRSGNLIPVMPYKYAIIPDQNPTLIASTGYPFEKNQNYLVELDTTDLFNSPFKTSTNITQSGGLVKWKPTNLSNMPKNQVYFWRTARNNPVPSEINWKESSFQYIPKKRGWSQDHFFQFKNDEYLFIEDNRAIRRFDFVESLKRLSITTASTTTNGLLFNCEYSIDAERMENGGCGYGAAIHIAVLDSLNFEPWGTPFMGQNPGNDFGQINKNGNCGKNRVQNFFIFAANSPTQLAGLKDMLQNKVPNGFYIVAYTWVRNDFSKWDAIDPQMRQVFTNLGATQIAGISNDSLPYIFFCKKGDPSTVKELVGTSTEQLFTLKADLKNNSTYGFIESELIGPASQWDSLLWDFHNLESPSADSIYLAVKGVNHAGIEKKLINRVEKNELMRSINNEVDPKVYPYIKLISTKKDDSLQTAPQLEKWQVVYQGVTELAINPLLHFEFYNDTVMEGESIKFSTAVENISDYDSDSVLIDYYILDRNRKRIDIPYPRQRSIKSDSTLITAVDYSSLNLVGLNTFVIDVNPNNDQPEQYHFNNIGQIPFYVLSDKANPVLDVTFDGIHILDGDIVSPKSEIVMQLNDENKYLELNDTSDFKVWLTHPSGQEFQIYFMNSAGIPNMQFIPGQLPKNTAKIIYRPELKIDGMYKLRVQAADRSKNESGNNDYEITFEVVNRSTITNMINYPNPFTTSTRFVFILTGSQIPDAIQIQILTVTGKIVKTIDQYEIGPINIGRNITQYAWDGKDEYGDRLANGVYLYKVNAQINGENIEHRSTSADKYFKKGFGKMYLMK